MSEPWTPGPWEVKRQETPKGDGVSLLRLSVEAEGHYIAWLSIHQEKDADARLIAAAPEMASLLWIAYPFVPAVTAKDIAALISRIRGEA